MAQGKETHATQFFKGAHDACVQWCGYCVRPVLFTCFTTVNTVTGMIVTLDNGKGDYLEINQYPWLY